jgi:purine-binding chemotaxis protein CheW
MTVREIRAWSPVTRLPRVPDYVAGVVNLRGAVLPVIDLAARLGWAPTDATPRNPIIVIEHQGQMRGLIVHDVADIVGIEAGTLQQPDAMGHETITHFLEGIAPLGEDMVMVLDLARLMADEPVELAA